MILNLEHFEAWLFAQPDDREYAYIDIYDCLISRFAKETTNVKKVHCGPEFLSYNRVIFQPTSGWRLLFKPFFKLTMPVEEPIPAELNWVAVGGRQTFGDAKARFTKVFLKDKFHELKSNPRANHCPVPACN